jgi:hypothetical protein
MTGAVENIVTFQVERGIFGVGSLATRLKALESVDMIGPWHIGNWIDYKHTAIRVQFNSVGDAKLAQQACAGGWQQA